MEESKNAGYMINTYFKRFYPPDMHEDEFRREDYGGNRMFTRPGFLCRFPRITCADGFTMSVQAHAGAYSSPRDDLAELYTAVEVGFPSAREEKLMPYIDGDAETDPTNTVYGYVPVHIVEEIIADHGGIAVPISAEKEPSA